MRPTHVPAIHTATVLAISLASQVRNAAISPRVGSSSGTPMISIARDAATGSRGVETLRGRARTSGSAREGGVRLPAGSRLHSASVVSRQPRFEPSNRDFCAKWRCFLSHEPSNRQRRRTPKCRRAWDASATLLRPGGFDSRQARISRRFSRDSAFRASPVAQTPTRAFPASSGRRATPRACARPRARRAALAHARRRLPSPSLAPASLRAPELARSSRARRRPRRARSRTMPPPAAPSRASAFETVAEAVVPPLPLDDRSPPQRDAPPAPGAAGHDGRWNLAAATRAAFPERFPTLAAARKAVRRGEIRVAEPHHESNAPAPSAPASSAPASSAPAPPPPAAARRLPPSPRRFHRRLAAHVGVPRDGPERPPALRDPPGDRVRGRALRDRGQARGRAHGRRRGVDRGERPAVRPRAGGRVGGRAAAAEADAQARQTDGGAAALRQDEARAGNPRGGVRGEASDQEVQGAAVRRRER